MENRDLSDVHPLRWNQIRRRITVIENYLSLNNPTVADRNSAAIEIGLSVWQFGRLAETWRIHKRPSMLSTSASTSRRGSRRRDGIDDHVRQIVDNVISEVGTQARNKAVQKLVVERAEKAGVAPPSIGSVWNMLMESRRIGKGQCSTPDGDRQEAIAVGRLWLELPVQVPDGTLVRPEILVAVLIPEGEIAAVDLCYGGDPPSLAALTRKLNDLHDPRLRSRGMLVTPVDALGLAPDAWPSITRSGDAQATVARIFGRGIGRIDVRYRRSHTPVERHLKARHDEPLDTTDAGLAVEYAVREHNVRRTGSIFENP